MPKKLVTVEVLEPLKSPEGGRWAPGERAGFAPEVAADLVRRGAARPAKALDGPDKDKMLRGDATVKK